HEDLEFGAGSFGVKGTPDKALPLAAIAFAAFTAHNLPDGLEPNLEASVTYDPPNFSWPFGTHVCVVEVDEETGRVDVVKYAAVDALSDLGVTDVAMPASPQRVWDAIQAAKGGAK